MAKENWGSVFPGVRKCVIASQFPLETTEEQKEEAFVSLVHILMNNRVFHSTGKFYDCRERALDYLLDVMPRLEEDEIQLIFSDGNLFYKRFCFSPSKKTGSLYSKFKKMGIDLQDRYNDISVDKIFRRYSMETGLSPYELSETSEVNNFLEEIEAEPNMLLVATGFDQWTVAG